MQDIKVPTLAVHGTADRVVAFGQARAVADGVPRAELMAIAGGEHVCLFTHRGVVRARVRSFLNLPAPEGAWWHAPCVRNMTIAITSLVRYHPVINELAGNPRRVPWTPALPGRGSGG